MNRTSSEPKSVLHYKLDKGQHFEPETSFNQTCFSQILTVFFSKILGKLVTFMFIVILMGHKLQLKKRQEFNGSHLKNTTKNTHYTMKGENNEPSEILIFFTLGISIRGDHSIWISTAHPRNRFEDH